MKPTTSALNKHAPRGHDMDMVTDYSALPAQECMAGTPLTTDSTGMSTGGLGQTCREVKSCGRAHAPPFILPMILRFSTAGARLDQRCVHTAWWRGGGASCHAHHYQGSMRGHAMPCEVSWEVSCCAGEIHRSSREPILHRSFASHARSKRSRFITLDHAAPKSSTKVWVASSHA